MNIEKLSNTELHQQLETLNQTAADPWQIENDKLTKSFQFTDFIAAFGFMTQCAIYAEKVNHHPEWFNVYNRVRVQLTTHEASGISVKDFDLAKKMDSVRTNAV